MTMLIILCDPPWDNHRSLNALREVGAMLAEDQEAEVTVYLKDGAVACARKDAEPPRGHRGLNRLLKRITRGRGSVLLCEDSMNAQGMTDTDLVDGVRRATPSLVRQVADTAQTVVVS